MEQNVFKLTWTKSELWNGCMLASVVHAIMVSRYPKSNFEHSWDGYNYHMQDEEENRGTISFHPNGTVAAFRNENSDRLFTHSQMKEAEFYFKQAQKHVVEIASNDTLPYLLDDINGEPKPLITTAFWEKDEFYSCDSFEDFIEHGGSLLTFQLETTENAISSWEEYYDMNEEQCQLALSVWKRKIDNPHDVIYLTSQEVDIINSYNEEGLEESKQSFKEIGILF